MKTIISYRPDSEFLTDEGCYITELINEQGDETCSIARARVPPGVTTRLHYLKAAVERYVILQGCGAVEVDGAGSIKVAPMDVVYVGPGVSQRIANTGAGDLIFLCVCTPRFRPEAYVDIDNVAS